MADIDCYKYKAKGALNGAKFAHEDVVYAEHAWDAAELAEAEVRCKFPGVVLEGDELERGVTSSPQVFVTRDIVNRAVGKSTLGALLQQEIPKKAESLGHQPFRTDLNLSHE